MKKYVLCILLMITTLLSSALPTYAAEPAQTTVQTADGSTVTYFEDGSFLTVSPVEAIEESASARATAMTIYARRDATYTTSDGTVEWKYTLNGTFSYVYGVSATCTDASYTYVINDDSWSFSNGSATKSGNVARGKGTFKYKVLLITIQTQKVDLTLTCDVYGDVT